MASNVASGSAKRMGRQAAGHPWFHKLTRVGLAARGVIYVLIGLLAVQIGLSGGGGGKAADKSGALQSVADKPGGTVMLWVLALGFAGLALWRYSEAVYGQPLPDGDKATKRLASLARGVFYTAGCIAILMFVMGQGNTSSDSQSKSFTAKAMGEPGGRWLVLAIGLGFVGWGVANVVGSLRRKFLEKLRTGQMSARTLKIVKILGALGGAARGLVFGGVGVFLAHAAITFDAGKAKGLDGTLREFAATPAGPWLLVAVAVGLVLFGAYCFCEARWRKVEAVR
ncbi:DUF1206 domain-containing protein [Spirillospora sp. CA-253888]